MPMFTRTRRLTSLTATYSLLNIAYLIAVHVLVGLPESGATWTSLSGGQQYAIAAWIPWAAITALAAVLHHAGVSVRPGLSSGGERA